MTEPVKAWYFCTDERKLRYNDNRAIVDGETLTVEGEPVLCKWGLHASEKLVDALQYAPGATLCRVELSGTVVRGGDKLVASSRKVVWSIPSAIVLPMVVEFAKWCATRAQERAWSAGSAARSASAASARYAAESASAAAATAAEYAASAAEFARSAAWSASARSASAGYAAAAAWSAWSASAAAIAAWSAAEYAVEKEAQNNWWVEQLTKAGYQL